MFLLLCLEQGRLQQWGRSVHLSLWRPLRATISFVPRSLQRKAPMYFHVWGMLCLLLSLLLSEACQRDVCLWGIQASLGTFIHHLKALELLLIYLEGLQNYLSALSQSFLVVKTCYHQRFSLEFNENLVDRWVNVIVYKLEYCMQKDILNLR